MATTTKKRAAPRKSTTPTASKAPKAAVASAAPPKPSANPVPEQADPKVVQLVDPIVSEPDMKKKELVELVVERAGVKKRDAKPSVEAALAILGEALADGRELNLPPLGKVKINRAADHGKTKIIICKIRQNAAVDENVSSGPLADDEE